MVLSSRLGSFRRNNDLDIDIIITTDRTMMTDHHGKEFLGFMATGPSIGLPEFLWRYICCPKPKVDEYGRPIVAPYGLRKVEALMIDKGFKASIIDPDHVDRYIDKAKILMVGHHDYFAFGPPSSEWWLITKKDPINRKSFIEFMSKPSIRKAKSRGLKIIAGGPAAWQWFWEPELWDSFGIDLVIDGEVELVLPGLVEKLLNNDDVPRYIFVGASNYPDIDQIPDIKYASVNGLVEIMRGCPRGCSFCSVTLKTLRHYPIEKIVKEVKVNVNYGITHGLLHSDDVLLYGSMDVIPKPEPLLKLHEEVLKHYKTIAWSHASLAAIVVAEREYKLMTKLTELIYSKGEQEYLGVEVGLETGSPRLAKIIMPAKASPFSVDEYPDVAEEAFSIMHDLNIIPAATFILGLPGEVEDDVIKTLELLDRLKSYRSILVPMIFVPLGTLKSTTAGIKGLKLTRSHIEVMRKALQHSIYWSNRILNEFYLKGPKYMPLRLMLKALISFIKWKVNQIEKEILQLEEVTLTISDLHNKRNQALAA